VRGTKINSPEVVVLAESLRVQAHRPGFCLLCYERRDCNKAAQYYEAVAQVGPWSGVLNTGLQAHLAGDKSAAVWAYTRASELGYQAALHNIAWLHQRELAHGRVYRRRRFDDELARWPNPPPLPPTVQVGRVRGLGSAHESIPHTTQSSTLPPGGAWVSGWLSVLLGCWAQPGASPAAARQLHFLLRVHGSGLDYKFGKNSGRVHASRPPPSSGRRGAVCSGGGW
jgi:hypothetical protein